MRGRATKARRRTSISAGLAALAAGVLFAALAAPSGAAALWSAFGGTGRTAYPAGRLFAAALAHAWIAAAAVVPATVAGVALGIAVTRPAGRALRPLADTLAAGFQAVPPVVVVALAFPALGFGAAPTIAALLAYCLMPVLRATVAAIEAVPPAVPEAARAMGFTPGQVLWRVEMPLAAPVVAQAARVALVLAIATAAVGALAGAVTLGTPIIIGLQNQNELYILQGASATAALAFLADGLFLVAVALVWRQAEPWQAERPAA